MKSKIFAIFSIIMMILVIPSASAQEASIGEKANQKSVEVIIGETGDVHVKHIVSSSSSLKHIDLIQGTIQNLTITNEEDEEQLVTVLGENEAVMIFPLEGDTIVEYDLEDVLLLKDNTWTLDFLYLETTTFIIPEEFDLIFVNERPVYMDDKRGISCHGCQMILEYSINEPKNVMQVNWEDKEFLVEIRSFADVENFDFNQPGKKISFKVNDDNQFVTAIIPLELLWEPYTVFLDDEKTFFHKYINNGTHVWLNMRPETSGEITIIGTTVVPEFPIILPLAAGFLMILVMPLIRKLNLH